MADIELVIKIDEEDYNIMKHNIAVNNPLCPLSQEEMVSKVANGTPLPKGHGRLIDADKLEYTCNSDECGMLTGCNHCQYHIITEDEIDNAPTIIDADKESDN